MNNDVEWAPTCPMCKSENTNESILAQGGEIWVEKECNGCGVEWLEFFEYSGMDFVDPSND